MYAVHRAELQRTHPWCAFIRGRSGKLSWLSNWGKGSVPLFGTHEDIPSVQCPAWDRSVKEGAWQTGGSPVQGSQGGWKLQHTVQRDRLRETQSSLKQGRQTGDPTAVFHCLKVENALLRGQKAQGSHHTWIAAHRIPVEHKEEIFHQEGDHERDAQQGCGNSILHVQNSPAQGLV